VSSLLPWCRLRCPCQCKILLHQLLLQLRCHRLRDWPSDGNARLHLMLLWPRRPGPGTEARAAHGNGPLLWPNRPGIDARAAHGLLL
jgi:hypothetical protein